MKFLGLAICLGIIGGAAATVGIHLFFDVNSFVFVLGGAAATVGIHLFFDVNSFVFVLGGATGFL